MASSGYTAITFIANEQPTTAKWNLIGSNDASFNNGNGFEDSVIITRHLNTGAVTNPKLALDPKTNYVATTQSTSGSSFQDLGTVQAITYDLPANANVLVLISTQTTTADSQISVAVSGANTIAADNDFLGYDNGSAQMLSAHRLYTDLAAGSTTFTMKFGLSASRSFLRRRITVIPLGV